MTEFIDLFQYGEMRRGGRRILLNLYKDIEFIESAETSPSRRYKLLKAVIKYHSVHLDKSIENPVGAIFRYRFEGSKLFIDNKEAK